MKSEKQRDNMHGQDEGFLNPERLIDLFCIRDVNEDLAYTMISMDRATLRMYEVRYSVETQDCCCTRYSAECRAIDYTAASELLKTAVNDAALQKLRNTGAYSIITSLNRENAAMIPEILN